MTQWLLTLNAGSSSLKFALFKKTDNGPQTSASGQIEGIGIAAKIILCSSHGEVIENKALENGTEVDHAVALENILTILRTHFPSINVEAVGHRVVHGGPKHANPIIVNEENFAELSLLTPLAPLHQPHNLSCITAAQNAFPHAAQIACFDTSFHRNHPWVNDTFALPRRYYDKGVRRYGFHGLSYEYVIDRLRQTTPFHAAGRVVVAHLGNGASMCAIRGGQSIGSTMGFSALDGLPMGTRCGQLDPAIVLYLMDEEGLTSQEVAKLLYQESGLKGLSGLTSDMRTLEGTDTPEARQAIDYFVFRVRRELGAMTAILNGIDAFVFCGGIGENSSYIREKICQALDWLGLEVDEARNRNNEFVISSDISRVKAFVVRTNEELMIARHVLELLEQS